MIEEVEIDDGHSLGDYAAYAHLAQPVLELQSEARPLIEALKGRTVWMVNSTSRGGGVAEMLPRQISLLRELGLDVRWVVIGTERTEYFDLMKKLHNLIHGEGEPSLSDDERELYETVSRELAAELGPRIKDGDILVVHDPQPAGMGALIRREKNIVAIWRCHIGLDERTPQTKAAWRFLIPHVETYDFTVFSAPEYIPRLLAQRVAVITPAIDPLSDKNRPLSAHALTGVLSNSGLMVEHNPVLTPPFFRPAERLRRDGTFGPATEPDEVGLLFRPLVTQISRWDRLKGWKPLLDAFVQLKQQRNKLEGLSPHEKRRLELCRLVLAGPEPSSVADDPEAQGVLDELIESYAETDPEIAKDIVLLSLPMSSTHENALMVNALQTCSSIVVQNSLQEGFGLTVTEPMWKRVAVLGSPACGIRQQIRDDVDGRLHHDASDPAVIASALAYMLNHRARRDAWARQGQRRVHHDFLVFSQLGKWLRLLVTAVDRESLVPRRPSFFDIPAQK